MKDLIARLRIPGDRVMSTRECWQIADALEAQAKEIEALKSRLEIYPRHHIDGIQARDATIKLLDGEIEALRVVFAAAENLIAVKGRHHAEIAYKRLEDAVTAARRK